jgi:hypothetical protein
MERGDAARPPALVTQAVHSSCGTGTWTRARADLSAEVAVLTEEVEVLRKELANRDRSRRSRRSESFASKRWFRVCRPIA